MFKKIWNGIKKVVKCVTDVIRSIIGVAATTGGCVAGFAGLVIAPKTTANWMCNKMDAINAWLDAHTSKKAEDSNNVDEANDISDTKEEDETNAEEDI